MTSRFPLTDRFGNALLLAAHWYHGQYQPAPPEAVSNVPYISQPLSVAALTLEFGATEDEAITALLQSAFINMLNTPARTDQEAERLRAELLDRFGLRVTVLIDDLAHAHRHRQHQKANGWQSGQQEYLHSIAKFPASLVLVTAAAEVCRIRQSLSDLHALPAAQQSSYFEALYGEANPINVLADHRALSDTLDQRAGEFSERPRLIALLHELQRGVGELEALLGIDSGEIRAAGVFALQSSGNAETLELLQPLQAT